MAVTGRIPVRHEDVFPQPVNVMSGAEWTTMYAAVRTAVSAYVRAFYPVPAVNSPEWEDRDAAKSRYLLTVWAHRAVVRQLEEQAITAGRWAIHYGATPEELAAVDGSTPTRAAARFAIPEHFRGGRFLPQDPTWAVDPPAQTGDGNGEHDGDGERDGDDPAPGKGR